MDEIEYLRQKLYLLLEAGETQSILKASQELDKAIVKYIKAQLNLDLKDKSA